MTVRALVMALALVALLTGCGTDSAPSPPAGVDELTIPTPSPDPADFMAGVDNPWMPLPPGRTWAYQVVDAAGEHPLTVTATDGPRIAGVATTARVTAERGVTTTDWFAQDRRGNVWWFGRAGQWRAGTDGAEAGLAMPETPRVGDGYRAAYLPGVVEDVITVESLTGSATVPAGSYGDLLVTERSSTIEPAVDGLEYAARGTGLVQQTATGRTVRLVAVR